MKIQRHIVEVPVRNQTQVLVVGAGPAGFGAAVAAARAGAQVTLVERVGTAGGMWTSGLVSPFFDNHDKPGLNREIRDTLSCRHAWGGLWDIAFDPVQMAMLLDEYLLKYKIDVLFFSVAVEAIMEGNQVKGVIVENKSGAQAILADVVIDCTGDGDVAALAGAQYRIGRDHDHVFQPMTMMFKIGGVKDDYPRDDIIGWYNELVKRVPEPDVLAQIPYNYPAIIRLPRRGEALIQWTHIKYHNGTVADDLSQAMLEGRRQVRKAVEYLGLVKDVLGDTYLLDVPCILGVRETRRITGLYTVSDEDVRKGATHSDAVCNVTFGVDIHEPDKPEQTVECHNGFEIPFRAMLPAGIDGLITAGRCISGSYMAHAAYRVTGNCLAMGEGAGRAAAYAALNRTALCKIPDKIVSYKE